MKNNETGEFELVLGNRQLLSAFFIVVILFAVFFTMGYIVGRNSTPSAKLAAANETGPPSSLTSPPDSRPQAAEGSAPQSATPAETPSAPPADTPPAETQPATPPPATRPAEQTPAPATSAPAESAGSLTEPVPGQVYLQVMAVKRADAEVVARTLKEKGFTTTLTPAPDDRVRVLVGPYANPTALGKAKAELENAGFHPFVRK